MIESPQDSSSGIASDEHNSTPNGASTLSSSDPTYGFAPTKQQLHKLYSSYHQDGLPGHEVLWSQQKSYRDIPNQVRPGYHPASKLDLQKQQALSPRARLPDPRTSAQLPGHCISPAPQLPYQQTFAPPTTQEMILNQKNTFPYPVPPNLPQGHMRQDTEKLISYAAKKTRQYKQSYFDLLPDDVILRIFANLTSTRLCQNAQVCRRWHNLVWEPCLWTTITIHGSNIDVDRALKVLTRRLSYDTPSVCVMVEKIFLNGCAKLTDKGLHTIAKRCLELRHLEVQGCTNITNIAIFEVVSKCVNMEHLNVSGMYTNRFYKIL